MFLRRGLGVTSTSSGPSRNACRAPVAEAVETLVFLRKKWLPPGPFPRAAAVVANQQFEPHAHQKWRAECVRFGGAERLVKKLVTFWGLAGSPNQPRGRDFSNRDSGFFAKLRPQTNIANVPRSIPADGGRFRPFKGLA